MNGKRRMRRIALFGSLAVALGTALIAAGLLVNRNLLAAVDWRGYLRPNERATLDQALGLAEAPGAAPALLSPTGLIVAPVRGERVGSREIDFYSAASDARFFFADPLELLALFWDEQGLEVSKADGRLLARGPDGAVYGAARNGDSGSGGQQPGIVIWRAREALVGAEASSGAVRLKETDFARLLPPVADDVQCIQTGRLGAPGYSLSLAVAAPATAAFRALSADLEQRGWEPFGAENPETALRIGQALPGALSAVFRHRDAPLGCHLLVQAGPFRTDPSQVLLSLF